MKYQVRLCLGNFDTYAEAHGALEQMLAATKGDNKAMIIEKRIVDSNTRGLDVL